MKINAEYDMLGEKVKNGEDIRNDCTLEMDALLEQVRIKDEQIYELLKVDQANHQTSKQSQTDRHVDIYRQAPTDFQHVSQMENPTSEDYVEINT